jgi:hypothetical protein
MSDEHGMSADDLQLRMAQVRRAVQWDVEETATAAKRLADWQYYVRQFPWATVAAMAAVGFMLVPRKRPRPLVDESALKKMVAEKRVVVIPQKEEHTKQSALSSLGGLLAAAAAKAAMNYVSHRFTEANRPVDREETSRVRTPK